MAKESIYYSVNNGGDGSAYPSFFETLELADWDQDREQDGWGEPCTGSITFEGTVDFVNSSDIYSRESYLTSVLNADDEEVWKDYLKTFFDEKPSVTDVKIEKNYEYIYLDSGKKPFKAFVYNRPNYTEVDWQETIDQMWGD